MKESFTIIGQPPADVQVKLRRAFRKLIMMRLISENTLVLLLQYTGLMFSTLLPYPTPIWFASGTACAFIFLRGYSILPGIYLGSFLAYALTKINLLTAMGCATVHTVQAFALLWFSYRYISPTIVFVNLHKWLRFIFLCSILTAITSLILVCLNGSTAKESMWWNIWLETWLANLNGVLILSCAIVTWDMYFPQMHAVQAMNKFNMIVLYGLLFIFGLSFMISDNTFAMLSSALLSFLLAMIISYRFAWCGAMLASFLLGLLLGLAAYLHALSFQFYSSSQALLFLQGFLVIEVILCLGVAIKFS